MAGFEFGLKYNPSLIPEKLIRPFILAKSQENDLLIDPFIVTPLPE